MKIANYIYYHQHNRENRSLIIHNLPRPVPRSHPVADRLSPNCFPLSSFILHPSPFILHPSSFTLYPLPFTSFCLFSYTSPEQSSFLTSLRGTIPPQVTFCWFRGLMSRHNGRRLEVCILDMTRPFRAGREVPYRLYLHR